MESRDLERLKNAVKARRLELGLARKKAAEDLAGISKDTWQRVEDAKQVRDMNYAKIDQTLGWAVGSCILIAEGGEAVLAEPSEADPTVTLARITPAEREARIERTVQSATIAVTDLDAPAIRALSARIIEDLKADGII